MPPHDEEKDMHPMASATLAAATLQRVDAEAALDRARRRLHAAQRATVLCEGSPEALDEAVLAYREARAAADDARALWQREYPRGRGGAPGAPPAPPAPPAGEAPELRLARWLAEAARRPAPAVAA
jgi:hypothetical protein